MCQKPESAILFACEKSLRLGVPSFIIFINRLFKAALTIDKVDDTSIAGSVVVESEHACYCGYE